MTSGTNSSGSCFLTKKNSKTDDNYLKELNEDLKLRKQELLEMLKPLEDKNSLLFQKLMGNLEEKQRSLQIMRQIMAGRRCDESSVMELIKEAEEMKQNLEKKNKMLRKEMEMLWNKTFESQELQDQQKALPTKPKADLKDGKEKQQRKIEWVKYEEHSNILQNGFHGKVIELRIEALKNYQKANDLKLSLCLQHNFEPKQGAFNLLRPQDKMGTTIERATTNRNEPNMRIPGSKNFTEQQEGSKESQSDDIGERLFFLRSMPDEALKD
ncbi:putative coiled-coil domain-containing protein 196 isoform X1 [Mesocricetus auratus]|uniref:Coiled-coil domain-containing protein 196 isoform X1 n=1 Tax=Mesocricetus auratus TaxID=10036 RepID=A0ABM2X7H7_MESAU|nr:putative coiled-coil domain-containing protein 196 isoform X1 [Mesocricetus auratus]